MEATLFQYGIAGVVIAWLLRDNIALRKELKQSYEARVDDAKAYADNAIQGRDKMIETTATAVSSSTMLYEKVAVARKKKVR